MTVLSWSSVDRCRNWVETLKIWIDEAALRQGASGLNRSMKSLAPDDDAPSLCRSAATTVSTPASQMSPARATSGCQIASAALKAPMIADRARGRRRLSRRLSMGIAPFAVVRVPAEHRRQRVGVGLGQVARRVWRPVRHHDEIELQARGLHGLDVLLVGGHGLGVRCAWPVPSRMMPG